MKHYFLRGLEEMFGDFEGVLVFFGICGLVLTGVISVGGAFLGMTVLVSGGGFSMSLPFLLSALIASPIFVTLLGYMVEELR